MILRSLLAIGFAAVAVYLIVGIDPRGTELDLFRLWAALCLLLMAIAVGMRPLRWSGYLAFLLALVPIGAVLVAMDQDGLVNHMGGVLLLLLIGAWIHGLLQHTPESIAGDLRSSYASDRARGIRHLGFFMQERLRPDLRACETLLEEACQSEDPEVRTQAELIRGGPSAGVRDPIEELDDELSEALTTEALEDGAGEVAGHGPAPTPLSVAELIDTLRGGEPAACRTAIEGLVALGQAAVPALEVAADEGNPDLRIDALRALELIGQAGPDAG